MLLTFLSSVSAQPEHLQFNHLTTDDGLSASLTLSVLQDHKGFVLIGTEDGLNRLNPKTGSFNERKRMLSIATLKNEDLENEK